MVNIFQRVKGRSVSFCFKHRVMLQSSRGMLAFPINKKAKIYQLKADFGQYKYVADMLPIAPVIKQIIS